jgi:adenylate kinase family enzyme
MQDRNIRASAVLIAGFTGSGKTPLGELFEKKTLWGLRCIHFDFGEHLRRIRKSRTGPAALTGSDLDVIEDSLRSGRLLENENFHIAAKILGGFIEERKYTRGDILILNGLPRHVGQAEDVDAIVNIRLMVYLQSTPEIIRRRIRLDPAGDRSGRVDDDREAVERKLVLFQERTLPIVEHYRKKGSAIETISVNAETLPEEIYLRLSKSAYAYLWRS